MMYCGNCVCVTFYLGNTNVPCLVDGDHFLNSMALYESTGVIWAFCDDLMDRVQNGHYCISLKVLSWVLLATWQVTDQVPHSVAPCQEEQKTSQSVYVCGRACVCVCAHVSTIRPTLVHTTVYECIS